MNINLSESGCFATPMNDKIHGVMVAFCKPSVASMVWRFIHKEDGTRLRIFSDGEGLPIAIDFSNLPESQCADDKNDEPREVAIKKLHAFACMMIEEAQINQGKELLRDAQTGTQGDEAVGEENNSMSHEEGKEESCNELPLPQHFRPAMRRAQVVTPACGLAT